jgi:hypothetical protein
VPGLALVDPVVHRLAHRFELWAFGSEAFDYQLLTFGLVGAVLVALNWSERRARVGRHGTSLTCTVPMLRAETVGAVLN